MKAESAEPSLLADQKTSGSGWTKQRWIFFIALAFAAHLTFIFLFGTKTKAVPRPVTNVPQFQLAADDNELIALTDPTLFALPQVDHFAPLNWRRQPAGTQPVFRRTDTPPSDTPPFLQLGVETLGAAFHVYMQTNRLAPGRLDFKPEPRIIVPFVNIESPLPQHSTLRRTGELAKRRMLNPLTVPTLPYNDVIKPSRVQVLVDAQGNVASVVLLESSDWKEADNAALELARKARYVPAKELMFGELIFNWHTVPTNTP